jgi:hypothetical protein
MNFKKKLFLFSSGLLVGIAITIASKIRVDQDLIAPVNPTLAQQEQLISPLTEDGVLGVKTVKKIHFDQEKKLVEKNKPQKGFADLLNQKKQTNADQKEATNSFNGTIKIAVFGDSMTDLMGTNLPYLEKELKKYYPKADFRLFNYGIGAQNIEHGLARLDKPYQYKDRSYPALTDADLDLIIIDPFVYNPFSRREGELNKHWSLLAEMVSKLEQESSAQIMVLATIAPNRNWFGQGENGINWDRQTSWKHAERINKYLVNSIRFAGSAGLPLINVYEQTLSAAGEGDLSYINQGDHIHQNEAGNKLISSLTAEKIYQLELF